MLAQLGVPCEFLGNLSDSMELDFIQKDFIEHGVVYEHCPKLTGCAFPTSIVFINSHNGSRTILHYSKNLPELSLESFKKIDLTNYSWVHFEVSGE